MTADVSTQCGRCDSPSWIGDRHCRRCGQPLANAGDPLARAGLHVLDLDGPDDGRSTRRGPSSRRHARRNALVLIVGILGLLFAFSLIRSADEAQPEAAEQGPGTADSVPDSMYAIENPPERQAALEAFEMARERLWTLTEVFDHFGIDDNVVVHERSSSLELRRDARADVQAIRDSAPVEFGALGALADTPYRIGPDNPITIDRFDPETQRWTTEKWSSPPELNSLAPFTTLAATPTHLAAESGGVVRIWRRSDGLHTATIEGRLQASTGDLFFIGGAAYDSIGVKQPPAIAGVLRLQPDIRVWDDINGDGQIRETELFAPGRSGTAPIRSVVARDFTAVIDPSGWLVTRSIDEPTLPYNGGFIDIAAIADGSALLALTVDALMVIRFDGSPAVPIPVDIDSARGLSMARPAS